MIKFVNHYPTVTKPNRWHLVETEPASRGQQKQLRKKQSVCQFQPEWAEQTSCMKWQIHQTLPSSGKCEMFWGNIVSRWGESKMSDSGILRICYSDWIMKHLAVIMDIWKCEDLSKCDMTQTLTQRHTKDGVDCLIAHCLPLFLLEFALSDQT